MQFVCLCVLVAWVLWAVSLRLVEDKAPHSAPCGLFSALPPYSNLPHTCNPSLPPLPLPHSSALPKQFPPFSHISGVFFFFFGRGGGYEESPQTTSCIVASGMLAGALPRRLINGWDKALIEPLRAFVTFRGSSPAPPLCTPLLPLHCLQS